MGILEAEPGRAAGEAAGKQAGAGSRPAVPAAATAAPAAAQTRGGERGAEASRAGGHPRPLRPPQREVGGGEGGRRRRPSPATRLPGSPPASESGHGGSPQRPGPASRRPLGGHLRQAGGPAPASAPCSSGRGRGAFPAGRGERAAAPGQRGSGGLPEGAAPTPRPAQPASPKRLVKPPAAAAQPRRVPRPRPARAESGRSPAAVASLPVCVGSGGGKDRRFFSPPTVGVVGCFGVVVFLSVCFMSAYRPHLMRARPPARASACSASAFQAMTRRIKRLSRKVTAI